MDIDHNLEDLHLDPSNSWRGGSDGEAELDPFSANGAVEEFQMSEDSGMEDDTEHEPDEKELDLRMYGIHQALPVEDGDPDFGDGPPETAEEYLRRVRYEAVSTIMMGE